MNNIKFNESDQFSNNYFLMMAINSFINATKRRMIDKKNAYIIYFKSYIGNYAL